MRIQKKTDLARMKGQALEHIFHQGAQPPPTLYNKEETRNSKRVYALKDYYFVNIYN